jgi:hypothetical protein
MLDFRAERTAPHSDPRASKLPNIPNVVAPEWNVTVDIRMLFARNAIPNVPTANRRTNVLTISGLGSLARRRCWSSVDDVSARRRTNSPVFKRHRANAEATKLRLLSRTTPPAASIPEPNAEISSPPIAGPTSWAALNEAELRPTAFGSSALGTRSATKACRSGASIAVAQPNQRIRAKSIAVGSIEVSASTPIRTLGAAIAACETRSVVRRFHRSAMTPPG